MFVGRSKYKRIIDEVDNQIVLSKNYNETWNLWTFVQPCQYATEKNRLDTFWSNQELLYNCKIDLAAIDNSSTAVLEPTFFNLVREIVKTRIV